MNSLAIVVRDDAFDRILTPLTFAYTQARAGVEVDMLFVLWAVRALTPEGAATLKVTQDHAGDAEWLRGKLVSDGEPTAIADWLAMLRETGRVRLYGLPLRRPDLRGRAGGPPSDGIVDPSWFLREKAMRADHTQYF